MTQRRPRLTADEVIRILRRQGFILVSQRGSHQKWRNDESRKQLTVPYHRGKQLPMGTLNAIMEGSGIPLEEFHP